MGLPPEPEPTVYIGRRNIEGGGRYRGLPVHTNFRIVLGAKGSFYDDKWDYNAWWQTGKNSTSRSTSTTSRSPASRRPSNVVPIAQRTGAGAPVCASVVDGTDPNCVPYDIFHLGGVTQAALNYLQTPGIEERLPRRRAWWASP